MLKLNPDLLDQLLTGCTTSEDLFGAEGVVKQITAALANRMLEAELTHHLGYKKSERKPGKSNNARNGHTQKTVQTEQGTLTLQVPRDRQASFEPLLLPKHQRRFAEFDQKILSLYARGLSTRDIQSHLQDIYQTEVSPELISTITNEVLEEVALWQQRPLAPVWPILWMDALVVKIREGQTIKSKAMHLVLGLNPEGRKEVLGMWMTENEGAKFWSSILTELRQRGVRDILVACCDGLKGFPEAIRAQFPETVVQTCLVHMVRNTLHQVSWSEMKELAKDLRSIYTASTEVQAWDALTAVDEKWGKSYPLLTRSWQANWDRIVPFLQFPPEIRKAIYTTNAIEGLNRQIRKGIKTKGLFPHDESAFKLIYLILNRASKEWTMPIRDWSRIRQQFALHFPNRFSLV
jgi:putative transposase